MPYFKCFQGDNTQPFQGDNFFIVFWINCGYDGASDYMADANLMVYLVWQRFCLIMTIKFFSLFIRLANCPIDSNDSMQWG